MVKARWWLFGWFLAACGDSGTGGSAGTTGDTGSGTTNVGTSTTAVDPTTGSAPTTGGSQTGSGTSTGPLPETTGATTTGDLTVTSTSPDDSTTSTGPDDASSTSAATSTTGSSTTGDGSTGPQCAPGQTPCGDLCVDTSVDPENCGDCGSACALDEICVDSGCVALVCEPGTASDCYSGPPGTLGVGVCTAGARLCNDLGTELGPCVGEVVPTTESCDTDADDDCDGKQNEGCYLANCAAIKQAKPDSSDGNYKIDLDGDDGPIPPFMVKCDMTIQGGGWTRFNWLHTDYTAGQDPLGQTLQECNVSDLQCRGRIPAGPVKDLLVKDLTDVTHAMWTFNNGTISNALLAALQSKVQYCGANQGAFQPVVNTSGELYCGNGQEGGCDSFFYTSGACNNVGNWGIHWDGDGAWCAAAFKMGATFSGCGNHGDQGFLNECACDDEKGELYYR